MLELGTFLLSHVGPIKIILIYLKSLFTIVVVVLVVVHDSLLFVDVEGRGDSVDKIGLLDERSPLIFLVRNGIQEILVLVCHTILYKIFLKIFIFKK